MIINELNRDDKINELLNDVERKYNTFSIGNTLFPKKMISRKELLIFFESLIDDINEISYAPAVVINTSEFYSIKLCAHDINTLIENVKSEMSYQSTLSFYDINFDIETKKYCCRIFIYDDPIKIKVNNRDNKINEILND